MQRRKLGLVAAVAAVLIAVGVSVPAQAAGPYSASTNYVAMGDSFSAGVGAGIPTDTTCGRHAKGYPTLWAQAHGIASFTDVSCGGAVGADVLANQISALSAATDVVTITIGGNDIAWGEKVTGCLGTTEQGCATLIAQTAANHPTTLANVAEVYAQIADAAPNADVYVLGYPHLYDTRWFCLGVLTPSQGKRVLLNQMADDLNATLSSMAAAEGFTFVDARTTFAGHGVCSSSPWIRDAGDLLGLLHPNADGYRYGYLAALTAVTG